MKTFIIKLLRKTVFVWLSWFNKLIPHNSCKILFYTELGFRDNVKALYDYLVEHSFNQKYTIVVAANDYKNFAHVHLPNVTFVSHWSGYWHYFSAGYVFYCFGRIPFYPSKRQTVVQLWHGTPFKSPSKDMKENYNEKHLFFTHVLASSNHLKPVLSGQFAGFPYDKIIVCGQPRNDALFSNHKYDFGEYKKLVVWAPTFRTSKIMGNDTLEKARLLPIFDVEKLAELNAFLREREMKIIVKLHPMQSIDDYQLVEMENLLFLSHAEFVRRKMDLYLLLSQADALITDYSSIFSDYLLLNRPIAFTEDDLEEYQHSRGFSVPNIDCYKAGARIRTEADFYVFIETVLNGSDCYENARRQANLLLNDYVDGNACQRVVQAVGIEK